MLVSVTSGAFAQAKTERQVASAVEQLRLTMMSDNRADLDRFTADKLQYGHSGGKETNNTQALRDDAERSKSILDRISAGRLGTPEYFKGPVTFLAAPASDYVNGTISCVDGGWMAR
jgi:NAD(P)-dependent dehydrogenase (short-subunit alcohol dehydrogenase family)